MRIEILANHGAVGGGEVMAMLIAEATAGLGHEVCVVGPADSELERHAALREIPFRAVGDDSRRALLLAHERVGRRSTADLLWCNGPVPALATTASRRRRITHLHQVPSRLQALALAPSRARSVRTLVPSISMAAAIPGAESFANWTAEPTPGWVRARGPLGADGTIRVGFIGRTSTDKGLHTLAAAVDQLRSDLDVTLVVAGDGRFVDADHLEPVEAALARLGGAVDRIGWVDRDEFFGQVDIVVVPSIWAEPFGLVATEAMARRVPLLVTSSGALPEIVGSAHPWVVGADDAPAMASALRSMIGSPERVGESVAAAAERWRVEFSPAAGAPRVRRLLESLT